jgi:hypothetical protein
MKLPQNIKNRITRALWHMPPIPATQEVEVSRLEVPGKLRQKVRKIPYQQIRYMSWVHL